MTATEATAFICGAWLVTALGAVIITYLADRHARNRYRGIRDFDFDDVGDVDDVLLKGVE